MMRYYCIKQLDITDCGVACLATICKQKLKWVKQIGIYEDGENYAGYI